MQWIETSGKDLQEAVESALFQLGIARDELEFTVISEPRRGILGLGKIEARIRARVKPAQFKPKEALRRSRDRQDRKGGKAAKSAEKSPNKSSGAKAAKETAPGGMDGKKKGARKEPVQEKQRGSGVGPVAGSPPKARKSAAKRSGVAKSAATDKDARQGKTLRTKRTDTETTKETAEVTTNHNAQSPVPLEDQAEAAREFLAGLVDSFGVDGNVEVGETSQDAVTVSVTGEELGLLIGPKASTLTAIQELTRIVAQRSAGPSNGRLFVDVGGYRAKRRAALEAFARKIADEVLASGKERVLEAMVASDRKVIHDTVNEIDGMATRSEGEEPDRRVVVAPAS